LTESVSSSGFSTILQKNKDDINQIKTFQNMPVTTKARNIAFTSIVVGSLFFTGLFALQIIQGLFALVMVGCLGVGSFFSLRFLKAMDPAIQQKTRNYRIKVMTEEARKNSISQLDNQVLLKNDQLKAARKSRDNIGAMLKGIESEFRKSDPTSQYHSQKEQLYNTVKTAYEKVVVNVEKAKCDIDEFTEKVNEFKKMEKFSKLINKTLSALGSTNVDLDSILSLAAFEQIEDNFNNALVGIENASRDLEV